VKIAPITEHSEYSSAQAEINKLGIALGKVRARLAEISILLSAPPASRKESSIVNAALEFAETGVVKPAQEVSGLNEERQVLARQETALLNAMELHRLRMDKLIDDLSGQLKPSVMAAHAGLAKRYIHLLEKMDEILEEESELVRSVESAGYRCYLRGLIARQQLGRIGDTFGSMAYYLHRDVSEIAAG